MHLDDPPLKEGEEDDGPSRAAVLISLGGLAGIVLLVLLIDPLRTAIGDALSGDTDKLRDDLQGLGVGGVLLVLGLAIAHSIIWFPTEILNMAAGFIYGFWGAFAILSVGWLINGLICFYVGRHAARPALARFFGVSRFMRYERVVERGGATLLLAMRLIPIVPYSLFSYAAGSARVPVWRFTWTSFVGYLPITVISIYFGSQLEELSLSDPLIWIGAAAIVAMLVLARRVLPRFTEVEDV